MLCVKSENVSFPLKRKCFYQKLFLSRKILATHISDIYFGEKFLFYYHKKSLQAVLRYWLILAWVTLKVLMFHRALQTGSNRFQHTMLSFLLPGWKHLKKMHQTWSKKHSKKKKNTSRSWKDYRFTPFFFTWFIQMIAELRDNAKPTGKKSFLNLLSSSD